MLDHLIPREHQPGLYLRLLVAVLLMHLPACDGPGTQDREWEPVAFEEISSSERPPCIYYWGGDRQIVVTSVGNYENIRRQYAPQGNYVDFYPNGAQQNFRLPYQPLGSGPGGSILPHDLIIYVKDKPLYANINGELIVVSSNPIRMEGDSIMIFLTTPPYTVGRMVHYQDVFTVDQVTGEVTFNIAPQAGSKIWMCATNRLYETWHDRECSMDYFNFDSLIMLGKVVTGDGCLRGFEKELYLDHAEQRLIYQWRRIEDNPSGGCPSIAIELDSWITVEKPPAGYNIVFIND